MTESRLKRVIAGLRIREFFAEVVGDVILYTTLFGALIAWYRFSTVYALVVTGFIGLVIYWLVYNVILGE